MARAKKPVDVDPNKLKRERAGRYVTPDGRFAVEGPGANGWYIVDSERENELGLPLMAGPFATLDDARTEVADLRSGEASKPPPLRIVRSDERRDADESGDPETPDAPARRKGPTAVPAEEPAPGGADKDHAASDATPPPAQRTRPPVRRPRAPRSPGVAAATTTDEPAWLERLPDDQQGTARHLLGLIETMGLTDQTLVRRELEANLPEVSQALLAIEVRKRALEIWRDPRGIAREIDAVEKSARRGLRATLEPALNAADRQIRSAASADDLAAFAWVVALRTIGAVFEAIDQEGREGRTIGEPGWRLLELDGRREPTKRAIVVEPSDILEPPED